MPAETKAATAGSGLPRNGAAVERAERKGVAQARIEFQADERCAVELLSSIVTLDRALPPDRPTGQRRGDTAAREHGHDRAGSCAEIGTDLSGSGGNPRSDAKPAP